jgi:hypothetical protein
VKVTDHRRRTWWPRTAGQGSRRESGQNHRPWSSVTD